MGKDSIKVLASSVRLKKRSDFILVCQKSITNITMIYLAKLVDFSRKLNFRAVTGIN